MTKARNRTARGTSMDAALRSAVGYTAALVILLGGWALASLALATPALPLPTVAFARFVSDFPDMVPHALTSLTRVVVAMLVGTGLGLPIGLYAGRSRRFDTVFSPLMYLTYPVPKVVFLPVFMVLLGLADAPKIALIGVVIFFQTMVTARDAARNIPEASVDSVRSLGASPIQIATNVVIPAAMADVFTALRINTGTAVAVLFLSESIAGSSGLGYFIMNAWSVVNYPSMFAGIIMMSLVGVGLYEVLNLLERYATRWRFASAD